MSWLTVPDDAATAELERLTEPWRSRGERVPPVMGVLKRSPNAFQAVLGLNYALAFGASSLGRRREELIATCVSALNDCFFCLATHARYLEKVWRGSEVEFSKLLAELTALGARLRRGEPSPLADLSALPGLESGDAELLEFVIELSLAPQDNGHALYARLRAAGYSETEVLDAVLVCACFAFMNRLACGTGVALEASKYEAAVRLFGQTALDRHVAWAAGSTKHE